MAVKHFSDAAESPWRFRRALRGWTADIVSLQRSRLTERGENSRLRRDWCTLTSSTCIKAALYRVWLCIQFQSPRAFLQREALGWLAQLNCCTWLPGDEIQPKERKRLWGPQCSSPLWKYKWIGCQMHCSLQSSKTQSALQSVISSESDVGNVVSSHKAAHDAARQLVFSLHSMFLVRLLRLWPLNSHRPH